MYWLPKMRKFVSYKCAIIKYLLHRKTVLGLTDLRTLVLEQYGMDICLLTFHSFFHSTNVYEVSPENKAPKRMQRGKHKNPSSEGVPILREVIVQ